MPLFDKAERVKIRSPQQRTNRIDLTPYKSFLQKYKVGVTVDLPSKVVNRLVPSSGA